LPGCFEQAAIVCAPDPDVQRLSSWPPEIHPEDARGRGGAFADAKTRLSVGGNG